MFKRKEQRRRFTREEKEQMLAKSNGKDSFNDSCPFLA